MRSSRWWPLFGAMVLAGSPCADGAPTVTADSTSIGALTTITGTSAYQISGGKIMGANQFLSFDQFSLNAGDSATFNGPVGIQNILARVTGGSPSNINGTISSTINGANLFLLNPSGVMFGANAQVNISGAFTASTANYIQLAGAGNPRFYSDLVNAPIYDGGLTSASVASFGFLSTNTSGITVMDSSLSVDGGLQLISGAGGVSLTGATLTTSSGVLGVFAGTPSSATNPASVSYLLGAGQNYNSGLANFSTTGTTDGVALANSHLASGAGGGVVIRGGKLVSLDAPSTIAVTDGGAAANGVSLTADTLMIDGGVSSSTSTAAAGGDVALIANTSVAITGSVATTKSGAGKSGAISIDSDASDSPATVSVTSGGSIASTDGDITMGSAIAVGDLTLTSGSISTQAGGTIVVNSTGAVTDNGTISTANGNINIDSATSVGVGNIAMALTGKITSTGGSINLGSNTAIGGLDLEKGMISTQGSGSIGITSSGTVTDKTTISAPGGVSIDSASAGNRVAISLPGGSITSTSGNIALGSVTAIGTLTLNGGTISTTTGAISVNANGAIALSNGGAIQSQTAGATDAGTVAVTSAGTVSLDSGGLIQSITTGSGNAGEVEVQGNVINIGVTSGNGTLVLTAETPTTSNATTVLALSYLSNTGIFSLAEGTATGNTGAVNVTSTNTTATATAIQLENGGQIATATTPNASGNAGNVTIEMNAGTLIAGLAQATSPTPVIFSTAGSSNFALGGAVTIKPQTANTVPNYNIELQGGASIQTATENGGAGDVTVRAQNLTLDSDSSIESDVNDAGGGLTGSVAVAAYDSLTIDTDALIKTQLLNESGSFGDFGNLLVQTNALFVGGSTTSVPLSSSKNLDGNFAYTASFYAPNFIGKTTSVAQNITQGTGSGQVVRAGSVQLDAVGSRVTNAPVESLTNTGGAADTTPALNQIVLDGSLLSNTPNNLALGTTGTIQAASNAAGSSYTYTINTSDGVVVGNENLFLSFSEFNLASYETALFSAAGLQNIVARVTGGKASTIEGTLAEAVGTTAHVFLINPYGFMFTNSSSGGLQLNGALTISTATSMNFTSGTFYGSTLNSANVSSDNMLKADAAMMDPAGFIGSPTSFGFDPSLIPAGDSFGSITMNNVNFSNAGNLTPLSAVQLIGGNISLQNNSYISANQIVLFSAANAPGSSAVTVPLNASGNPTIPSTGVSAMGDVSLTGNSILYSTESAAATIEISGDTFELTNSFIIDQAFTASSVPASIIIRADTATILALTSSDFSFISTANLSGPTSGGTVEVDAENLTINANGSTAAGILSTAQPANFFDLNTYNSDGNVAVAAYVPAIYAGTENGDAGAINLNLSGTLNVMDGGIITGATNGLGTGSTITIDGLPNGNPEGLPGGNPQVILQTQGEINSATSRFVSAFTQTGNAGSIVIEASSLSLSGSSFIVSTAGLPDTTTDLITTPTGRGGDITIGISGTSATSLLTNVNNTISITGEGFISVASFTAGAGGQVAVGQTVGGVAYGIPASVTLADGGEINASALGDGDAGSIALSSGALTIDGSADLSLSTGILSETMGSGAPAAYATPLNPLTATGNGGDIMLGVSGAVQILGGGQITVSSLTQGMSGKIAMGQTINGVVFSAPTSVDIDGTGDSTFVAGIFAEEAGSGNSDAFGTATAAISLRTSALKVENGGEISTQTSFNGAPLGANAGNAGDIAIVCTGSSDPTVLAFNVTTAGQITSATSGIGLGGNIALTITGDGTVTNGGQIVASSSSTSSALSGEISINQSGSADLGSNPDAGIWVDGTGSSISTAAGALSGNQTALANTHPGDIAFNVQALTVSNGGIVTSSTSGPYKAGDVFVNSAPFNAASASALSVVLETGGRMTSDTAGAGAGGQVMIDADALSVDGVGAGISTVASGGTGNGGQITLNITGNVAVTNGGTISASSQTTGAAGAVTITQSGGTQGIVVDGDGSSISTNAGAVGLVGNSPGEIKLTGSRISIDDDGSVTATTSGLSKGGTITASSSGVISLSNGGNINTSSSTSAGAAAANPGAGNGGSININCATDSAGNVISGFPYTGTLDIFNGSTITASSLNTTGGTINVFADTVDIEHHSSIETKGDGANNNGGDITINAGSVFYLYDNSDISTHSGGIGGNITIDPEFTVLDNSYIDAFGGRGDGNVLIESTFILSNGTLITATGSITLDAVPLDLAGSLVSLPADLTDDAKRLRESCARAVNHEFSSLIVVGRGGTETAPDELNPDFGIGSAASLSTLK